MKEITKIHIARVSYEIEIDAKKELEKCLAEIKIYLENDENILEDIEQRIVELLNDMGIKSDDVITIVDIENIKEKLGEPKVFKSEESEEKTGNQNKSGQRINSKKLYRDPDNAVILGVCGGIAAYFNIDVVIIRIIAIFLGLVSFGMVIIAYIALVFVLENAETPREKLEMRGDDVTVKNIKKTAKDIGNNIKATAKEAGENIKNTANKAEKKVKNAKEYAKHMAKKSENYAKRVSRNNKQFKARDIWSIIFGVILVFITISIFLGVIANAFGGTFVLIRYYRDISSNLIGIWGMMLLLGVVCCLFLIFLFIGLLTRNFTKKLWAFIKIFLIASIIVFIATVVDFAIFFALGGASDIYHLFDVFNDDANEWAKIDWFF